jgi:dTDP-4-dehydrorhamnose reductase
MILLTGGSGLLGTELQKHLNCVAPPHAVFDVERPPFLSEGISMIVHCAAYTDVAQAEHHREDAYGVNVMGTLNMALMGKPLVYISTEYVFDGEFGNYCEEDTTNPINVYARTKELGEHMAMRAPRWLIIRALFKPRPFKHPRAVIDQYTSGDYVDVIAPMIATAIDMFAEGRIEGVLHIGTGRKSTFYLASQSRTVEPITREQVCVPLPRDTSLNLARWQRLTT